MAGHAIGRESALHVVRVRRLVEVVHMAGITISRRARILASHVARRTGYGRMRTCQRELRRVVVELPVRPCDGAMACLARRGEPGLRVRRIVRAAVVFCMTAVTIGRRPFVLVADVAGDALERGMGPGQGESELRVVHLRAEESIHRVAFLAVRGEARGNVVRLGALVVLRVARHAVGGQSNILAGCRALVTGLTVQCGMRTQQREAVAVLLDRLDAYAPTVDGVTLLAIRAELAPMDIGVAIRALRPGIAEH